MTPSLAISHVHRTTRATVSEGYWVTVDYDRDLQQMIQAGEYDDVGSHLTADNYAVVGDGKVDIEVVQSQFKRPLLTSDALNEIGLMDLRAAMLPELLAFGEMNMPVLRRPWIIALGSVWQASSDTQLVPAIYDLEDRRGLTSVYIGKDWEMGCCFLAVHKESKLSS